MQTMRFRKKRTCKCKGGSVWKENHALCISLLSSVISTIPGTTGINIIHKENASALQDICANRWKCMKVYVIVDNIWTCQKMHLVPVHLVACLITCCYSLGRWKEQYTTMTAILPPPPSPPPTTTRSSSNRFQHLSTSFNIFQLL